MSMLDELVCKREVTAPRSFSDVPCVPDGVVRHSLVGSVAIHGVGADCDYVVLVRDLEEFSDNADSLGWSPCSGYADQDRRAFRKGDYNLIATEHVWLFNSFVIGTEVMKTFTSSTKETRAAVYTAVRETMRRQHVDGLY